MVREDFSALASLLARVTVIIQTIVAAPFFFKSYSQALLGETVTTQTSPLIFRASPSFIARKILWPLHKWAIIGGIYFLLPAHWRIRRDTDLAGNLPGVTQTMFGDWELSDILKQPEFRTAACTPGHGFIDSQFVSAWGAA